MAELSIIKSTNPFDKAAREMVIYDYDKQSIREIVSDMFPADLPARVLLNGEALAEELWDKTLTVKDHLIIAPELGGKQALQVVLMIVVAVVSWGVGGMVAGGAWGAWGAAGGYGATAGYAAAAAVSMAGGVLMGQIFTPDTPEGLGDTSSGTTYSWNPVMTQAQGVVIPKIYGIIEAPSGNIISAYRGISSTTDNPFELNMLISYGFGPIKGITSIKIGDQILGLNDGITTDIRRGYLDQVVVNGFERSVVEAAPGVELTDASGEYQYPLGTGLDSLEVDVSFPNGLYDYNSSGNVVEAQAHIVVELIDHSNGDARIPVTITANSLTTAEATSLWSYGENITVANPDYNEYAGYGDPGVEAPSGEVEAGTGATSETGGPGTGT